MYPNNHDILDTSRKRVATLPGEVAALMRRQQADVAAARSHYDPNLSPEGLSAKRAELSHAAERRYAAELDRLQATASSEGDYLASNAAKHRPTADPAVLQHRWSQVERMLASGMTLPQVVAQADAETLAAVKDGAPSWYAAQGHKSQQQHGVFGSQPDTTATLAQLGNSIDARLAQIGDADTRWAMEADRESRAATAVFDQYAAHMAGVAAGRAPSALETAVAAGLAGHAATSGLSE